MTAVTCMTFFLLCNVKENILKNVFVHIMRSKKTLPFIVNVVLDLIIKKALFSLHILNLHLYFAEESKS